MGSDCGHPIIGIAVVRYGSLARWQLVEVPDAEGR
jgi:hypothetical protein